MTEIPDKTKDLLERLAPFITTSGEVLRTIVFSEEAVGVATEALLAAEKRGEERERERCAGIAHKQVFTAKQWGGKDEMLEGGNRRARVIAYLIRKEPAE